MALNNHEEIKTAQSRPRQEYVDNTVPAGEEKVLEQAFQNYESGQYDQTVIDKLVSMGELLIAPVDSNDASPRVRKLLEGFNKIHEERNKANRVNANMGFLEWDATKLGFGHPCLIVFHNAGPTPGEENTTTMSYSLLVVEDEIEFDPVTVPSYNQQFLQLPVTVDATLDQEYYVQAEKYLTDTLASRANLSILAIPSGASAVYRNVDLEDERNIASIYYAVAKQCMSAITDETIIATNNSAITLGNVLRRPDIQLRSKTQFNPKIVDPSGLPVYADVRISTQGVETNKTNQNNQVFRRSGNDQPLADVSCMVDLFPMSQQPMPQQMPNQWGAPVVQPRAPYFANIVVTDISNSKMITLSSALLALSTAMICTAPEVLPELFKPNQNPDHIVYGDIGDVGHKLVDDKGPVGRIPVDSAEFSKDGSARLYELVARVVDPNVMLSIDVPNLLLGPRAIKTVAAAGSPNANDAYQRVVSALDQLTNGLFSKIWQSTGNGAKQIVLPNPIQIPLGYYIDQRDNQRDLRELTNMSAMRWSAEHNDPNFLASWYHTMMPSTPQREAVAERLRLMSAMVGGEQNICVKGFAWRYTLDRDFIVAAAQATVQAGVAPSFNNLNPNDQSRLTANFDQFQNMLINQQTAQQYFSSTNYYNQNQQQRGPAGGFFSNPNYNQYY